MNNFGKNLALWIIIGLLLIALFNLLHIRQELRIGGRCLGI